MGLNLGNIYNKSKDIYDIKLTESFEGSVPSINYIDELSIRCNDIIRESFYDLAVVRLQEAGAIKKIFTKVVDFLKSIFKAIIDFVKSIINIFKGLIAKFVAMVKGTKKEASDANSLINRINQNPAEFRKAFDDATQDKNYDIVTVDIDNIKNLGTDEYGKPNLPTATGIINNTITDMNEQISGISNILSNAYSRGDVTINSDERAYLNGVGQYSDELDRRMEEYVYAAADELFGNYSYKNRVIDGVINHDKTMRSYASDFCKDVFGSDSKIKEYITFDMFEKCLHIINDDNEKSIIFLNTLEGARTQYDGIQRSCDFIVSKLDKLKTNMDYTNFPDDETVQNTIDKVIRSFKILSSFIMDCITTHQQILIYKATRIRDIYGKDGFCWKVINTVTDKIMPKYIKHSTKHESATIDGAEYNSYNEAYYNTIDKLFNIAENEYSDARFNTLFEQLLLEDDNTNQSNDNNSSQNNNAQQNNNQQQNTTNTQQNSNNQNNATNNSSNSEKKSILSIIKDFFRKIGDIFKNLFKKTEEKINKTISESDVKLAIEDINGMPYSDDIGKITITNTTLYDANKMEVLIKSISLKSKESLFPLSINDLFNQTYIGQLSANSTSDDKYVITKKILSDMGISVQGNEDISKIKDVVKKYLTIEVISDKPKNIDAKTFDILKSTTIFFLKMVDEYKDIVDNITKQIDNINNANFDNYDPNTMDDGVVNALEAIFGSKESSAKSESTIPKYLYGISTLLEDIQLNGVDKNNGGGNNKKVKLFNAYINALKDRSKTIMKIYQACLEIIGDTQSYTEFVQIYEAINGKDDSNSNNTQQNQNNNQNQNQNNQPQQNNQNNSQQQQNNSNNDKK
nr:MAG TPA: hypothetical protein [Caudoviricetes sp.]